MVSKRKSPPGPTDPPPAKAKKRTAGSKENAVPSRRSGRTTKGQGGELQQKQSASEAVQPHRGLPKQKRSHVQDIPTNAVINPMAPMPPKRSKRSKADVLPTPPQGIPMPTVPRPISYISRTEPNLNNGDSRFGFHLPQLPPRLHMGDVSPLVASSFNASSVTMGVSPITPVAEVGGGGVPIDPVLLAESQSQLSLRLPPVTMRSDRQRGPLDRSKGQVTGTDIYASGTLDLDGGDDSEDDRGDEIEVEDESDGSDSDDEDDELELVLPNQLKTHDSRDNAKSLDKNDESDNDGDQTTGAECSSTHHYLQDPTLEPGFDQSPSEDERFALAQLHSPSEPEVTFEGSTKKGPKRASRTYKRQRTSQKNPTQITETGAEGNETYDVVGKYYQRNRAPLPPDPIQLNKIRSQDSRDASVETGVDGKHSGTSTDDEEEKTRTRHHSQNGYSKSTDPKRLSFYPPQWRDVLESAQKLWRSWMVLECGFPERGIKGHLDKAMQCVTDALREHQENGGKVEKGIWEKHQHDMREYIFADRSTFRGIIKNKAANSIQLYNFHPEVPFNNQEEHGNFISDAIRNLIQTGNFLHDGDDELGRRNNLTHPAIKDLSIFIYKLVAPSLPANFGDRFPNKIVALAGSAIKCCLESWTLGYRIDRHFTATQYGLAYNRIIKLIENLSQNRYHWEKFTTAQRTWARQANLQTRPEAGFETMDMEICLD